RRRHRRNSKRHYSQSAAARLSHRGRFPAFILVGCTGRIYSLAGEKPIMATSIRSSDGAVAIAISRAIQTSVRHSLTPWNHPTQLGPARVQDTPGSSILTEGTES